jgi:HAD superfamily PSPase-like hydrolase
MARVRLVAFDMEGVLTRFPTVWELMHRRTGTWDSHGLPYWERYRAGELEYDEFARMDVACWRGAALRELHGAAAESPLMPGAERLLGDLVEAGVTVAVISNGLTCAAERFRRDHGVAHVHANVAMHEDGHLTGELDLCVPYAAKGEVLRNLAEELGVQRRHVAAVGDSHADVAMFHEADLSIAFNVERPEVTEEATHVVHEQDLGALRGLLL